jgi:hypothetical protein
LDLRDDEHQQVGQIKIVQIELLAGIHVDHLEGAVWASVGKGFLQASPEAKQLRRLTYPTMAGKELDLRASWIGAA